ncbi:mandelate racemase/muconate lactonizing enzyme family protein [Inquilinus limosus]|uniref:mandelate racemase/muconate lactonizing enzyme family protein n=1 Tax=Inquilinus limosus TaxID=171674 RepID=UPI003F138E34
MRLTDFTLTRFQFARDRVIGDSQVRITQAHIGVVELHTDDGRTGTGFFHSLFHPLPALAEIERVFGEEAWPGLAGQAPAGLIHRVSRPRGGNNRRTSLAFEEAVAQALWDLAAQEADLPLYRYLGGGDPKVRVYASGLDFHLTDDEYGSLFRQARDQGFRGFKIKVGHPDIEWDLRRLALVTEIAKGHGPIMIDANEAWSPKEAIRRLDRFRRAGFEILWVEDPCLRDDVDGLREIRLAAPHVLVNSGEYLDLRGKRRLLEGRGADLLNVHGHIGDVMKAGWLAAEHGVPVTLGNTSLEIGVHLAAALPEADWLEYSFQNYNHLVEEPIAMRDGFAYAPDRPGHGLALSARARAGAAPEVLRPEELPPAPASTPIRLSP